MQIHQLVPALHQGDAIGDSARAIRDHLRSNGFDSDIFAYDIDEEISHEGIRFPSDRLLMEHQDILILHFALPSGMTGFLRDSNCRKAMIYHNVTPSYFWLHYDRVLVHLAFQARKELQELSLCVERAAGDSEYNRLELQDLGYPSTCVLPIYVPFERYHVSPSRLVQQTMNDGLVNFLTVGRIAPNKKLEDVLRLYFFYKKLYNPLSRLILVGKTNVTPAYYSALKDLASRYGLLPEDVLFTGHVDWPELVAYYKNSHVFISMSEHEGFCVPVVEAMICNTPVLAYNSTAVPYTLGGAGILFSDKNYPELAALCHKLWEDSAFRNAVVQKQKDELSRFTRPEIEKSIQEFLSPLL